MDRQDHKIQVANEALKLVSDNMCIGLGTGTTANCFIRLLAQAITKCDWTNITGVPTSKASGLLAEDLGIKLVELTSQTTIDLTVDGADEISPQLALIKGGGGALLREKIVANAAKRVIIIADIAKRVDCLGKVPLPVEVTPFGGDHTAKLIARELAQLNLGDKISPRLNADGELFFSENANYIFDLHCGKITNPELVHNALCLIPGVVETGLFFNVAEMAIIAGDGGLELTRAM